MTRPDMDNEIKGMLSAYLDGELTQADRQRVRLCLENSAECRRELEEMAAIKNLTEQLQFQQPPDEVLDEIEQRISVQAPRRFGWSLVIVALCSWLVYAAVVALKHMRWPTWPEMLGGGVIAGLLIVFLSVLRQRLLERPHDRYRKVRR